MSFAAHNSSEPLVTNEPLEPEELEEYDDQVFEMKNFSTITPRKSSSIPIIRTDEMPKENIPKLNLRKRSSNRSLNIPEIRLSEDCQSDEDDSVFKPRVERFLSIVELPPEVLLYAQQKFQINASNIGIVEPLSKKDLKTKKQSTLSLSKVTETKKVIVKQDTSNSSTPREKQKHHQKIRYYHDGSGLSQTARANIIKDIIKNFDLNKYLNDFKSSHIVELKLDKK